MKVHTQDYLVKVTLEENNIKSSVKNPDGKPGYTWDYDVNELGYKYYMIDILGCYWIEQMKKLDKHLEIRRHIQKRYNDELSDVLQPPEWVRDCSILLLEEFLKNIEII